MKNSKGEWICDFCGKNEKDCKILIVYHGSLERYAAICGDCVVECVKVIVDNYRPKDE